MSRRIAALINESEQTVTRLISELEAKNGYPSHDVRHIAENIQRVRAKISDLRLDPDDTTAPELYHALLVKFEKDAAFFDVSTGPLLKTFEQRLSLAAELTAANIELPSQWSLKPKAVKNVLRSLPPKRVMKFLGYRSVDSLLKRESVYELMLGTHLLESKIWHKNLTKSISALDQVDFELRPVRIERLDAERWLAESPASYTVFDNATGAAAIVPSQDLQSAPLLTLVLLLMEELMPSSHIKAGSQLAKMSDMLAWWADMDHLVAELAGQHVSLNLKDCALNSWLGNDFDGRLTRHGRQSFWQSLISRYQNRPPAEELFDAGVKSPITNLRLNIPQPVFEFAEEFDG